MNTDSLIDKLEALRQVAIDGGNPEVLLDMCIRIVERHWESYVPEPVRCEIRYNEADITAMIVGTFPDNFEEDFKSDFAHALLDNLRPYLRQEAKHPFNDFSPEQVEAFNGYYDGVKGDIELRSAAWGFLCGTIHGDTEPVLSEVSLFRDNFVDMVSAAHGPIEEALEKVAWGEVQDPGIISGRAMNAVYEALLEMKQ